MAGQRLISMGAAAPLPWAQPCAADSHSNELSLMGSLRSCSLGTTEHCSALPGTASLPSAPAARLALASSTFLCRIRPWSGSRGAQGSSVEPRRSGTHHKQSRQDWADWCLMDLAQLLFRLLLLPTICILLGNTNRSKCPFLAFVLTFSFVS